MSHIVYSVMHILKYIFCAARPQTICLYTFEEQCLRTVRSQEMFTQSSTSSRQIIYLHRAIGQGSWVACRWLVGCADVARRLLVGCSRYRAHHGTLPCPTYLSLLAM